MTEQPNTQGNTESVDAQQRRSQGVEKALKRLKLERQQLRDEARALRDRLAKLEAAKEGAASGRNADPNREPEIGDYSNSDDFWRDHRAWEMRNEQQEEQNTRTTPQPSNPQQHVRPRSPEGQRAVQVLIDAINELPDADRVWQEWARNDDLSIHEQMMIAIADTDDPAKVIEALSRNPARNNRIAAMRPEAMAAELDKLAWGDDTETAAENANGRHTQTDKRPVPIKPERPGESGSAVRNAVPDTSRMSVAEYEAYRFGKEPPRRPNEW